MPILDEYGEVDTIFGCITDIDAQKGAENESLKRAEALERARASEHRFVRFTESAALPIYILDHPSRTITYCKFPLSYSLGLIAVSHNVQDVLYGRWSIVNWLLYSHLADLDCVEICLEALCKI